MTFPSDISRKQILHFKIRRVIDDHSTFERFVCSTPGQIQQLYYKLRAEEDLIRPGEPKFGEEIAILYQRYDNDYRQLSTIEDLCDPEAFNLPLIGYVVRGTQVYAKRFQRIQHTKIADPLNHTDGFGHNSSSLDGQRARMVMQARNKSLADRVDKLDDDYHRFDIRRIRDASYHNGVDIAHWGTPNKPRVSIDTFKRFNAVYKRNSNDLKSIEDQQAAEKDRRDEQKRHYNQYLSKDK